MTCETTSTGVCTGLSAERPRPYRLRPATQNGPKRAQSLTGRNSIALSHVSEALSQSILVVDDDEPFRTFICRRLRWEGLTVFEAVNGIKAIEELRTVTHSALVTDMLMPECDGVELIVAARRLCPAVPIIAMSAQPCIGHLDLLDLARLIGADAVYSKGQDAKVLLDALRRFSIGIG